MSAVCPVADAPNIFHSAILTILRSNKRESSGGKKMAVHCVSNVFE